jgi:hypothetical protein
VPLPPLLLLVEEGEGEGLRLRLAVLLLGPPVPVQRPPGVKDEVDALLRGVAVACW